MEALLQATGVASLQTSPQQAVSPTDMEPHVRGRGDYATHRDHSHDASADSRGQDPGDALKGHANMPNMMSAYQSPPPTLSTARPESVRRSLSAAPYSSAMGDSVETAPVDQGESILSPQKINWEYHGPGSWLSVCSEPGVRWVCERTGVMDFTETARDLTMDWTRRLKLKHNLTQTKPPELDMETAWQYCTAYFEDSYDAVFGVVYRPAFEARLRSHFEHYISVEEDPSWYALRNTVYASGCRIFLSKDPSTTFLDAQVQAWQYFENALSVLRELELSPAGLSAIQALTVMTFYVEGLGGPALEYMLCANTARLAQAKGLHRQPSKSWKLPEIEIVQRNWLFWTIYCVEKLIAYRSGRPSAIDDDDISCQVPNTVVPGSAMDLDVLTAYVQHAQLSSMISRRLLSVKSFQQSPSVLIQTVQELGQRLQHWRDSLPPVLQMNRIIKSAELPRNIQVLHVVKIRFLYCGSLMAIHTVFAYPWISALFGNAQTQAVRNQIAISSNAVAEGARSLILAVRSISVDVASPQWSAFYYPMVGFINLFIYILKFPGLPSAQSDVALLDVITGHFGHMEFVTSSELRFCFAREAAALAHATVRRAREKTYESPTTLPPLMDGNLPEMDVDAFMETGLFDGIDYDMESWNIFSSGTMDGLHND
ncbi:hypothetical protein MMC08_002019 [Hypocenomyce scalaris]|nr:hypothetical protein [Hypocenomyce scalaris]